MEKPILFSTEMVRAAIERKRRRMHEAQGDARLCISQELDKPIIEYGQLTEA